MIPSFKPFMKLLVLRKHQHHSLLWLFPLTLIVPKMYFPNINITVKKRKKISEEFNLRLTFSD